MQLSNISRRSSQTHSGSFYDRYSNILYPHGKADAETRQHRLYFTHLFLLVTQISALIALIIGLVMLYVLLSQKSDIFYYISQLIVEVVLFSFAASMVCNPNQLFGILLITGHLSVVFFAVFLANKHTNPKQFECWNDDENCLLSWNLRLQHHLFYSFAVLVVVHLAMSLMSMMVVWYFEGSVDHIETMPNLTAYLGARLSAHALPNSRRHLKSTTTVFVRENPATRKPTTPAASAARRQQSTSLRGAASTPKAATPKAAAGTPLSSSRKRKESPYVGMAHTPRPESPLSYLKRKEVEAV